MIALLILAHILGDYLLQTDLIARWKARSLWGVLAHGGIVTGVTLLCTGVVAPAWLPYALLVGLSHTAIDVVKARVLTTQQPALSLILLLLDQTAHGAVIVVLARATGAPTLAALRARGVVLADPTLLSFTIGYLLLLNPTWVLLRFVVRGIWGADAAPHLGAGEKYAPMVERALIATCVLLGQFALAPVVLLPRRLRAVREADDSLHLVLGLTSHWAETLLGALWAAGTGMALRLVATLPLA
jgi:hypothetical protein